MPAFITGLDVSRLFYEEIVGPLLESEFPGLVYSAALIGYGSEVLGYDSGRSTDQEWGPRALLFLSREDFASVGSRFVGAMSEAIADPKLKALPGLIGKADQLSDSTDVLSNPEVR